jgi:ElaB/YqjD/DUF883 family membrane-anchored ribosome-binding protein
MSQVSELADTSKRGLVAEMKTVVSDAEEVLRETAGISGTKMGELRERIRQRLFDAKLRIEDAEIALVDRTKAAASATNDYVKDNPWKAVGVAASIGLLIGIIIGRR